MGRYIIKAIQTNYMEIEVEAESFEQAERIYDDAIYIEDDYIRRGSDWQLDDIVDETGESYF